MKKLKIKIKDYDKKEFELLEKGEIGDFFSLNDLNEMNFDDLDNSYKEKVNLETKKTIEKEKHNWENEFKNSNEYLNLREKINQLENNNKNIQSNINTQVELKKNEFEKKIIEENEEFKNKLRDEKENFEKLKIQEIEIMKKNIALKEQENKNILEKQKEIETRFNEELQNKVKQSNFEITKELESQFDIEKEKLENQINVLERNRNLTSKLIGEGLEKWINDQYHQYFGLIEDSRLDKANDVIDGTKPDFIFKTIDLKDNSILSSITIEAKSQGIQGNHSKKNEDFYEKLNRDRIKNKCEYALLVSELETDNNFSILKVNNFENMYENMYIIRPLFFIPFISLVRSIGQKRKDINTQLDNFKDKQEIIDEFEKEKNLIIDNSLKNIQNKLIDIHKKATNIIQSAQDIIDSEDVISSTHMQTIVNKITSFSILKAKNLKKVDFINQSDKNFKENNPKLFDEKLKIH